MSVIELSWTAKIIHGIWISSYFSSQFIKLNYSWEKLFFVSEEADFVFKLPKYLQGDIWFWSCSDTIHKAIWYLVFGSRYVVVGICYHTKTTIPRANWYSVFGCCYFCSYFAHDQIWQALCSWTGHGSKVHQIRECRTVFPSLEHFLPQNIFLPPNI